MTKPTPLIENNKISPHKNPALIPISIRKCSLSESLKVHRQGIDCR